MWKKIVFAVVSVAVLATAAYLYFHVKEVKTPVSSAINAIPLDASIIFESRQSRSTWKKLSQANIMWSDLIGTDFIAALNRNGNTLDSLLALDPEVSRLFENRSVLISLHKAEGNKLDFLYLYSLPNITKQQVLEDFIRSAQKGKEPAKREVDGITINTLHLKDKRNFHYAFSKGVLISGFNVSLVERSIRQLSSGTSLQDDKHFSAVQQSAGEKVDGNIYVNYKHLPAALSGFVSSPHKDMVSKLEEFAAWTEVDATIRPNELMLSGFTTANDSINNYLGLFRKQSPQEIRLTRVLPASTSSFIFYGISDFDAFYNDYNRYCEQNGLPRQKAIGEANSKTGTDTEKHLISWIGNEMAALVLEPTSTDLKENSYAVFHAKDTEEAKQLLSTLADSIAKRSEAKPDTSSFQGYQIKQIASENILSILLGPNFSNVTENYYTIIENYVVFGNSTAAMHHFINSYKGGKTLRNDQYYASFAENNLSEDASLYIYSNIARSPYLYKAYASDEHAQDIERFMDIYRRFQAIGIQFSSNKDLFYSTIFLKHNPIYKEETNSLWELPLDTTISSKPVLVTNHNTKAKDIFVQDDGNKIYLISNTGKLLWKRQLDGKIMSEVVQVDGLKNGKLQIMFNTRSTIYVIDRNGKDLQGFPVKLKSPATNGMTVLDYEKNNDYRLLIACENKRLLNLKMNAQLVDGWEFDKTTDTVSLPVQHHNIGGKDHLFVVDSKGKVYVLDRHGKPRIKNKIHFNEPVTGFFIEPGKDITRSSLIAANTAGIIIRLVLDGNKEEISIREFTAPPVFDYRDIDGDKYREYILLDAKELSVYRQDRSLAFKYQFKDSIRAERSLFFLFSDNKGRIGAVSPAANEIYLVGPEGELQRGFPLTGSNLFSIGRLNDDDVLYLVTAGGRTIYVYSVEQ